MPILLEDHGSLIIVGRAAAAEFWPGAALSRHALPAHILRVALVNLVPARGRQRGERQFRSLLEGAAGVMPLRLSLFAPPETDHGESELARVPFGYVALDTLFDVPVDAVVIIAADHDGAEVEAACSLERLTRILDWAAATAIPTVLSGGAAAAGLAHLEGIRSRDLAEPRFGVYRHETLSDHPLLRGVPQHYQSPHFRSRDLDRATLEAAGYTVLSASAMAGVDIFVSAEKEWVLGLQAHPEFDPETLLIEYRHALRQFLVGKRATYPALPHEYFDAQAEAQLDQFRQLVVDQRSSGRLPEIPNTVVAPHSTAWREPAITVFGNWLTWVRERAG